MILLPFYRPWLCIADIFLQSTLHALFFVEKNIIRTLLDLIANVRLLAAPLVLKPFLTQPREFRERPTFRFSEQTTASNSHFRDVIPHQTRETLSLDDFEELFWGGTLWILPDVTRQQKFCFQSVYFLMPITMIRSHPNMMHGLPWSRVLARLSSRPETWSLLVGSITSD